MHVAVLAKMKYEETSSSTGKDGAAVFHCGKK